MLLGRFEDSHQLLLGNIFVLELVPGGPAFHCEQIQVNDILFKVDQQPVKGWSLDQVAELIKGSLFLSLTFFVSVLVCICWYLCDICAYLKVLICICVCPYMYFLYVFVCVCAYFVCI